MTHAAQLPSPGTPDHAALVEHASTGGARDRQRAFEMLVRIHWDEVYRVCTSICGILGDDAAQEAFVKAFDAMADDPPRRFRTWLLTIARNRALDHRRAGKRYREVLRESHHDLGRTADLSPEEQVMWRERIDRLRRVLERDVSNPNQRDAFLMRLNTRLDDRQIGEVLGVSAKAVRSYVCKTRKLLVDSLYES